MDESLLLLSKIEFRQNKSNSGSLYTLMMNSEWWSVEFYSDTSPIIRTDESISTYIFPRTFSSIRIPVYFVETIFRRHTG